ncbi:MAG TPA: hypothetical protein VJ752_21225 [Burkholderiaceae bacterium]|nr:hypothetical protein [Burkholderiaceae bacterium]
MKVSKSAIPALTLLALAALAGCGGGGGATVAASTTIASPQGVYQGAFSTGGTHNTLVLENNQFYTIYGSTVAGVFTVEGFLQGNAQASGGSFAATDVKDATTAGQLLTGSLSASYTATNSLNGTLTEGSNTVTFTSSAVAASVYDYNTAANLNDIAGTWSMTSLRGYANTFNIAASGAFTATSGACAFSGSFKPRASGKNVFDVSMTFGPAPCILAGQTLAGIGIDFMLNNGKRQLLIAGLDANRSSSAAFFGTR